MDMDKIIMPSDQHLAEVIKRYNDLIDKLKESQEKIHKLEGLVVLATNLITNLYPLCKEARNSCGSPSCKGCNIHSFACADYPAVTEWVSTQPMDQLRGSIKFNVEKI